MFNKSKKYGIIKGLPFVCFANINGTDFKSGTDNIKVIVDDVVYSLNKEIEITKDNSENISLGNFLIKGGNWKKGAESGYDQALPDGLDGEGYSLVSYILNSSGPIENKEAGALTGKKYNQITSDLTLNFESVYSLNANSKLYDGVNEVKLEDLKFLFSDLKGKSVDELIGIIKTKCSEETYKFGSGKGGCLKDVEVKNINLDEFYISAIDSGKDITPDKIINAIKNKELKLTFAKYFNYEIYNIKLEGELAKISKPNGSISDFKTACNVPLKKQLKQLKYSEIKDVINNITGYKNVDILVPKIDNALPEGKVNLTITADPDGKLSDLMKGSIKFALEGTKNLKFVDESKGNPIEIEFGKECDNLDKLNVTTETTKNDILEKLKTKILGVGPSEATYAVSYNGEFSDEKVKDGFEVIVTFKGVVTNFTEKLTSSEVNVNINYEIENDSTNEYQLQILSSGTKTFDKSVAYEAFISSLKSTCADIDKEIKEVKIGTKNIVWSSNEEKGKPLENFLDKPSDTSINVTITLKKAEDGTYVKKKDKPKPEPKPEEGKTIYNLKVSCVQGYKLRSTTSQAVSVELENSKLNNSELYEKVKEKLKDGDNFIIKKGGTDVTEDVNALDTNTAVYSVVLTKDSSLIEPDKKDDPNKQNGDDKNKQNGGNKDEQNENKPEKKGCCGGKCSGPKDKK